ncbi:MAG: ATP phosphoribosyltransferase regulatory subunit [Clostridia bacterium]|nr:ATP phosphoribosyltransferase regulatory subunit [Clostridia bacterium]
MLKQLMSTEDSIIYSLKTLYKKSGYSEFKMRRFEEYSMYAQNKSFLMSEDIITFNGMGGKLLALKPDVTLSIVKNTKADTDNTEKIFYRESVFRADKQSHEYKEINQIGLEVLGNIDKLATVEILQLAMKSLEVVSPDYILDISHMGLIMSCLDDLEQAQAREEILGCIGSKNIHDLKNICMKYSVDDDISDRIVKLVGVGADIKNALEMLKPLIISDGMKNAYDELFEIYELLNLLGCSDKIRIDLSLINDIDYYNGIVMKGYIKGIHKDILSGGRYDNLTQKFNKSIGAMGFAIYMGDLLYFYSDKNDYDADVLILYNENSDLSAVVYEAEKLRSEGRIVRVDNKIPKNFKYLELEQL